MLHMSAWRKFW